MASTLVLRSLLAARNPFDDAKVTLSSWDNCMAKNYCKWPVIAAIIVGGIIVLSVVMCIARCICCGAELACCCFKCCTCCCPSGGNRRSGHKRVETPPPRPYDTSPYSVGLPPAPIHSPMDTRPPQQQYRSHAVPTFNPAPSPTFNPAPAPSVSSYNTAPKPEASQFARFDAHAPPVNEDALPAMPSWRDARTTHVEEEYIPEKRDDVEMDRLDQNGSVAGISMAAVAAGGAARRSPVPARSPVQHIQAEEAYGYPQGYLDGSYANNAPHRSPSNAPSGYSSAYSQQVDGYQGALPVNQSLPPAPLYSAGAGYAQNQQYDRRSPGQLNTSNYGYNNTQYSPRDVSPLSPSYGMYNTGVPTALAPGRDPSPVYSPSGSTRFEPPAPTGSPAPAYPGQQTYGATEALQSVQAPYRAYTPAQSQDPYAVDVARRPVNGSWKEV
ncbi:hypothetical protein PMIN06_008889 [Paraphaeosphaeria minitans]|uniref:Fibroin-3 related protein n=1 Tax=Paraphaeosphaeria minitans TaxID=565426 RepID=A0A9P6KSL1_9PLEO|nr:fibroin-3 related protein [Paraphaeosphaeria minitans]